ncbi:hypothetical protein ACIPWL_28305 [Streptomyces sp. NPDC090023]|uniref:hypothetical protein n=1 Tax=unclassified Streptomyces TaxID=2593676 RepID=UPI0037FA487B
MPAPSITLTHEPSGSVVAKGATDDLSARLLKHAGFQQIDDWYGRRHRLPTTTPLDDKVAIATHAAEMLRAAHYGVYVDPSLDTAPMTVPAHPLGLYTAGAEIIRLTEQVRSAENGADLRRVVDHLLHPEYGVLECAREALEAVGEQVNDLDDDAYELANQFGLAAGSISSAWAELADADDELRHVCNTQQSQTEAPTLSPKLPDHQGAALATSPAAAQARVSPALGGTAAHSGAALHPPHAPGPRR